MKRYLNHEAPQSYLTLLASTLECSTNTIGIILSEVRSYTCKDQQGQFEIIASNDPVAGFSLVTLPGCCGVVVSTGAYVEPKYRKRGIGTLLNGMRKRIAAEWGYSLMLCTDVLTNVPQQKILKDQGWVKHTEFRNSRTNNNIALHSIPLKVEGIPLGFVL